MALYLKYRPQSLDQLIGQDHIKENLISSFRLGKLSHAYLFVGPRGTGKTSTARILAKMVNCTGKDIPCNKCDSCLSITDGSNLDLIEIDAASNRGIDDIRALRETIKLSPTSSKKKIYIIDEVHMLTTEAFNALLKTLEEPPSHAIFILATTEVVKVPQTILSRVQRLDFKLATHTQLLETLKNIAKREKIEIEDEALKLIVRGAEGSFRDGVKLLDQVFNGNKITVSDITKSLQSVEFESVVKVLEALAKKDATSGLLLINETFVKGSDVKNWMYVLLDNLRALVLIKNGLGTTIVAPEYGEDKFQTLAKLAEEFELEQLIKALDKLQEAWEKTKYSSIPSLPLEIAVVEICSIEIQNSNVKSQNYVAEVQEVVPPIGSTKIDMPESVQKNDDAAIPEVAMLKEKWNFVLETVKPYNFSLEALLRLVKVLDVSDGVVLLEVPYSFHQRILEAPKSRDLLESVLSEVLGKPTKVSCVLGNKPLKVEDIANVEIAADDEVVKAAAEIFGSEPSN